MAKNGKRRTGPQHLPPPREASEPFENLPKLPPPPINVAEPKLPKLALASRSPLSVAFRHIKPSWRSYIQYVDLAARRGDLAMARFRDCFEALAPRDKLNCWPEQVCDLANVTPGELVGAVCRQIWENKAAESSMVSSIAHPELMIKTAQLAKKPEHYHDRELFFRLTGSLPDKKGASINIFNSPTAQAGEVKLPDLGQGRARLRSFDEEIIEMSRDLEAPFLVKDDPDVPS